MKTTDLEEEVKRKIGEGANQIIRTFKYNRIDLEDDPERVAREISAFLLGYGEKIQMIQDYQIISTVDELTFAPVYYLIIKLK